VHRSFAQTMASVAASRLAAMESAQRDIEERLDDLQAKRHRLRQSAITEELLDVVSGFEVLEAR
jgi:F-type H+-transporting ATPase subunit gamma